MRPLVPAAALLALAACNATPSDDPGPSTPAAGASERLAAFFEEVFQEEVSRDPVRMNQIGIAERMGEWPDISDAAEVELNELRVGWLARLRAEFDVDGLSAEDALSYRLFEYLAERDIEKHAWRFHSYPVNQMRGWHTKVPSTLINSNAVASVADAEAYLARLEGVDELLAQVLVHLDEREQRGILPPKFVYEHTIRACRNLLTGRPFDDSGSDSTLYADFRSKLDGIEGLDAAARSDLDGRARAALLGSVRPAYAALVERLYALQAAAGTDDGVWRLPDGAAFYETALRHTTTTDLTADEIHAIGLEEVDRIHGEMRAIQARVGFEGTLNEFFVHLREDEQYYFSNDERGRNAYLTRAADIIDAMEARLDEVFDTKPRADMVVKRVEPYRERSAGKAFYDAGTPDGSRPGIYYANLYDMRDMPIYQMEALAYHEGIPGHHMQVALARELEHLPAFRRFTFHTAYGEGWALYCEYLPKEMGFYTDPYSDFGRLAMELWRACRLVVDTGIHARRWTREQAIAYLEENTPNPPGDCRKAIERYIVMPSQATAYKIGMIRIQELRAAAREAQGEAFDLRAFHDVVLTSGPVPLHLLAEEVEAWSSAVLARR